VLFGLNSRCGAVEQTAKGPNSAATGGERPAAVAGSFYPASAEVLRRTVQGYLKEATPAVPDDLRNAKPRALICPHAGYVYSGQTAAFAYKLLEGMQKPSRVILMGPSHHAPLWDVCSVGDYSYFVTPLGKVPVDTDACNQLLKTQPFQSVRAAHEDEHSLEVQLPFLQALWPDPPKIVPVLVGQLRAEARLAAAAGIAGILDDDTLVIVSSDFTHYGARFRFDPFAGSHGNELAAKIRDLDMGAVKQVEALDPAGFRDYIGRTGATICGNQPINVLLEAFSKSRASRAVFLRWANSGQTTNSYEDCVSYVAMSLYASAEALREIRKAFVTKAAPRAAEEGRGAVPELTEEHKQMLLRLARDAVTKAAEKGGSFAKQNPGQPLAQMPAPLQVECGAFVTLREQGELRGCIGHIEATRPLCQVVHEVAILAATEDPRFEPVRKEEVPHLTIEISALSTLQRIRGIEDVQVGRDGLIIRSGSAQGLLLPQVATEYGWTARQFLEQTCRKAGLPLDAWQQEGVTIYRFSAAVFGEAEPRTR
jgi:hypothetical protein